MARDRLVALGLVPLVPSVSDMDVATELPPFADWLAERFPDKGPERRKRVRAWKKRARKA